MDELEIYEKVNRCQTLFELANIIRGLSNGDGTIGGRTRHFNAEKMAEHCEKYSLSFKNSLTRNYGIRQQAMYILLTYG